MRRILLVLALMVVVVAVALAAGTAFAQGPVFKGCTGLEKAGLEQKEHRPGGVNKSLEEKVGRAHACIIK